jgi:hypothetical protein
MITSTDKIEGLPMRGLLGMASSFLGVAITLTQYEQLMRAIGVTVGVVIGIATLLDWIQKGTWRSWVATWRGWFRK